MTPAKWKGIGAQPTTDTSARRLVRRVLLAFLRELRVILKRDAPAYYAANPDAARPCHSCAFNPSTDRWVGMETTAANLRRAIADGHTFSCHQNIPWRKPFDQWTNEEIRQQLLHPTPCAGFEICRQASDSKDAFVRAVRSTKEEDAHG